MSNCKTKNLIKYFQITASNALKIWRDTNSSSMVNNLHFVPNQKYYFWDAIKVDKWINRDEMLYQHPFFVLVSQFHALKDV